MNYYYISIIYSAPVNQRTGHNELNSCCSHTIQSVYMPEGRSVWKQVVSLRWVSNIQLKKESNQTDHHSNGQTSKSLSVCFHLLWPGTKAKHCQQPGASRLEYGFFFPFWFACVPRLCIELDTWYTAKSVYTKPPLHLQWCRHPRTGANLKFIRVYKNIKLSSCW